MGWIARHGGGAACGSEDCAIGVDAVHGGTVMFFSPLPRLRRAFFSNFGSLGHDVGTRFEAVDLLLRSSVRKARR